MATPSTADKPSADDQPASIPVSHSASHTSAGSAATDAKGTHMKVEQQAVPSSQPSYNEAANANATLQQRETKQLSTGGGGGGGALSTSGSQAGEEEDDSQLKKEKKKKKKKSKHKSKKVDYGVATPSILR